MKPPNLKKWELKPELEGLLFFAQSIEELLFDYTIDTYKLPALNSLTLTIELQSAIQDLESGFLKQGAIEPITAEVTDALKKDPVIKTIIEAHLEEIITAIADHKHLRKLKTTIEYVVNKSKEIYFSTAMKLLGEAVRDPREKEKIVRLARIYVNELIRRGYAAQHIYFESDRFFFVGKSPTKIDKVNVIDDYFSLFSFESKQFQVLFRGSKSFSLAKEYAADFNIEILDVAPRFNFVGKSVKIDSFLDTNDALPLFIILEGTEAYDEFKARMVADERLFLFDSLAKYHIHRSNLVRSENALVFTDDQKKFSICKKPNPAVMKRPDRPVQNLSRLVKETVSNITSKKLDRESFLRLIRAYLRHNAAIRSEAPENELLEFWSAIEVLFPPSEDGDDRIVQIVKGIVPFICSEYAAKLASDLWLSIKKVDNQEVTKIVEAIPEGDNQIEKCLGLFAVNTNTLLREKIYGALDWHPLLKNRIYSLNSRFSSADRTLKTLNNHIQRVSWQVRRIYRARNLIVHSGKTLPYANILVENVHSYLDRVLDVLNERIFHSSHSTSVDQIVLELKLESDTHLRTLKEMGKTECTTDNYKSVLFGNIYIKGKRSDCLTGNNLKRNA